MASVRVARPSRGAGAIAAIACAQVVFAAGSVTDFDAGASGWAAVTGQASWSPSGGAPGGFLAIASAPSAFGAVEGPASYTGDLTAFESGMFTFDASVIARGHQVPGVPPIGSVPDRYRVVVTIEGANSQSATFQSAWLDPSPRWQGVSMEMSAATFGVSEATWASILSDVASIRIGADGQSYLFPFTFGLDNISLVPAPPVAGVVLAGAACFGARRRRGR